MWERGSTRFETNVHYYPFDILFDTLLTENTRDKLYWGAYKGGTNYCYASDLDGGNKMKLSSDPAQRVTSLVAFEVSVLF